MSKDFYLSLRGVPPWRDDAAIFCRDKVASTFAKATADKSDALAMTRTYTGCCWVIQWIAPPP